MFRWDNQITLFLDTFPWMAFIILIFAKMHSVSYGQGVMKYKSNCLEVRGSHTITKEKIYTRKHA